MALNIQVCARDSITQHGEEGYPDEICGILLGKDVGEERSIRRVMRIENSFEVEEQYHRFQITPQAMFKAEKLARYEKLEVLGVYHSHPDEEARPSEYDREHAAWSGWSYVIVSIEKGEAAGMRAWELREDRSGFDEEEIVIYGNCSALG